VSAADLLTDGGVLTASVEMTAQVAIDRQVETWVDLHYDFTWRSLRRLGVAQADSDDAAQQVFLVASRKVGSIRSGCVRAFLFQTALRVAADFRRAFRRRRESSIDDLECSDVADSSPLSDELVELRRARERLDQILDNMSLEVRAVFVLHEIDQMTMTDIANLIGIPVGTVASRLRRARQVFFANVEGVAGDLAPEEGTK
jgi:RNA polymerase sigma-70 factor, ECF subfamily